MINRCLYLHKRSLDAACEIKGISAMIDAISYFTNTTFYLPLASLKSTIMAAVREPWFHKKRYIKAIGLNLQSCRFTHRI
jgi:hypothetical protein